MKREEDLEILNRQLADFQARDMDYHGKLQGILNSYSQLLQDYTNLQSDYEEEKAGRERYKRLAKAQNAQPQDPYVLILVDGNEYIFTETLLRARKDGGATAAELLEESIKASLPASETDLKLVVKVFADLQTLSRNLARLGWVGQEARSLAPFTATFSQSRPMFDFIDSGDEEHTRSKLEETFRLFASSAQCRRVIFAACHDASYLNLLAPYAGRMDKLTLVKSANWEPRFKYLKVAIIEFHQVFSTSLPEIPATPEKSTTKDLTASWRRIDATDLDKRSIAPSEAPTSRTSQRPNPKHSHRGEESRSRDDNRARVDATNLPEHQRKLLSMFPDATRPKSPPESRVEDIGRRSKQSFHATGEMAEELPMPRPHAPHMIPVNPNAERLDTYLPSPSKAATTTFFQRAKDRKVCNAFHLGGYHGGCEKGESCPYDHSPIDDEQLNVLRFVVRQSPCPRQTACRLINCSYGHVCVKEDCRPHGKVKHCKMIPEMHGISLDVDHWEEPLTFEKNYGSRRPRDAHRRDDSSHQDHEADDASKGDQDSTLSGWKKREKYDPSERGPKISERDEQQKLNRILIDNLDGSYDNDNDLENHHRDASPNGAYSPPRRTRSPPDSHPAFKTRDEPEYHEQPYSLDGSRDSPKYKPLQSHSEIMDEPYSSRQSRRSETSTVVSRSRSLPQAHGKRSDPAGQHDDDHQSFRSKPIAAKSPTPTEPVIRHRLASDTDEKHPRELSQERKTEKHPLNLHTEPSPEADEDAEFKDKNSVFETSDWHPTSRAKPSAQSPPDVPDYDIWGPEPDAPEQHEDRPHHSRPAASDEDDNSSEQLHQALEHESEFDWLRSADPTPAEASSSPPTPKQPRNTSTKQHAAEEDVGWGDYRDGTFVADGWADDPAPTPKARSKMSSNDDARSRTSSTMRRAPNDDNYHHHHSSSSSSSRFGMPQFDNSAQWGGEPEQHDYHNDRRGGYGDHYDPGRSRRGGGGGGGFRGDRGGGRGRGYGGGGSRRIMAGTEFYEDPFASRGRGRGRR